MGIMGTTLFCEEVPGTPVGAFGPRYTPLSMIELQKTVVTAAVRHFSEVPQTVIARAASTAVLPMDARCVAFRVSS
jgi:hypothetical protein